jgi:hypothetical protein
MVQKQKSSAKCGRKMNGQFGKQCDEIMINVGW